MPMIRELDEQETHLAYPAFCELFPLMRLSEQDFVQQINQHLRPEGFRLIGSFEDGMNVPVAVAGFRALHNIGWGHHLYIDDLVTCAAYRNRGHATRLISWLREEGHHLGCTELHLDSNVGEPSANAHRFYYHQGLYIDCHHFRRKL